MERYIPAGNQNWVNIGTALTGLTIADLADDIVTTGFTGSDYPGYIVNNIQKYDETIDGQLNDGWEMTGDVSNALENDRGYMILMVEAAQAIDLTGGIQKGSYSQPINYNAFQGTAIDGWNLVTNRYPSEIDWDAIVALSTNVSTFYVFDAESGAYLSRNGNTQVGSASRYIASNQSFWVKADALGAILQWEESVKSSSGQAFERSMEAASFISLKIEGEGFENSAFVSFAQGATASYENAYDAHKLGSINSASAAISTLDIDGLNMVNNTLGSIESNVSIPVQLVAGTAGTYTFSIDEAFGIPATSCISIENTATGIITPIGDDAAWTVELDVNEVNTQFIIHLSAPVTSEIAPISCFGSDDATIELLAPGNGPWNVTWFNEVDFEIGSEEFTSSTVLENLPMGNYLAVLSNSDFACASVEQVFTIDEAQVQTFSKSSEASNCDWTSEGWIELEVENATSMNIILSLEGTEIFNSTVEGNNFVIDGLESGNYIATVETACISVSESIELFDLNAVTIVTPEQITAALENGLAPVVLTAEAENAIDIVWFENGVEVGTGSTLNLTLTEIGNYLFTAMASNETCSAADQTLVVVDNVIAVDELEGTLQFYASANGMELVLGQAMENLRFELFNLQGQLIQSERLNSAEGQQTIAFNGIAAGSYLATLTSNGVVVATVKIVR